MLLYPNQIYSGNQNALSSDSYKLMQVSDSGVSGVDILGAGWNNSLGQPLTMDDLKKEFKMATAIDWGLNFNIGNWNWSPNGGYVVAPVGSDGTKASIPRGSIAFKINKSGEAKIRVIVAVKTSQYYEGEQDTDQSTFGEVPWFGLWQASANGEQLANFFQKTNPQQKFQIPISSPYSPSSTASTASYLNIDNGDGTKKRCYLNGSKVLVAYEFTVNPSTDNNIFLLAATVGALEIVYFSADGTASAGRDGSGGSLLGTIDYVYSNDEKVITVTETNNNDDNGIEDPSKYYYSSLCLIYTEITKEDGSFVDINMVNIRIHRYVENNETYLLLIGTNTHGESIIVSSYASSSDKIVIPKEDNG